MVQSDPPTSASPEQTIPAWHRFSNMGLTAASVATALGFEAATRGTQLGFRVGRGITSAVAFNSTALAEHIVFGGSIGAAPAIGSAINSAFSFAESLALAPIQFGHNLASTSLVAASSSLDLLVWLFGTQEVGFSLAEFGTLVQREWANPPGVESLPEERYGAASIARALVTWAALQDATGVWGMKQCLKGAKEIPMNVWKGDHSAEGIKSKEDEANQEDPDEWEIIVTSDEQLPDDGGTLVQAQISHFRPPGAYVWAEPEEISAPDEPQPSNMALGRRSDTTRTSTTRRDTNITSTPVVDWAHLRPILRRMSHMVIGGYGGASFLFFGLAFPSVGEAAASVQPAASPTASSPSQTTPKRSQTISDVVHTAESSARAPQHPAASEPRRTWWGLITGQHDQEIFERFAGNSREENNGKKNTAILGDAGRLPRFWVLTDHARKQVVLVLRGTYSLNELAIDLTCDPVPFTPAKEKPIVSNTKADEKQPEGDQPHFVHGGMVKTAELMGLPGKPVHDAVANALRANRGYELILTGHSLGAGVASLLALMWADPLTGLTVRRSGLPSHRRVTAYCFGPPCVMSAHLSKLAKSIVTSFVYSHDIVSTLSLGSVRDMQRAAAWLCAGTGEESVGNVLSKATRRRFGRGGEEEDAEATAQWLLSFRKTLEANMNMADLFPPGRVLWALNDCDVLQETLESVNPVDREPGVLHLFEVEDVERAFSQIVFSRDMLSAHLPHNYNRVVQELL
ncbi:Lipase (class 3) [Ceratobasidium sp. AG-Ba]|nr:Lipase (class 3) [Ceratobasidium sp. AG-Ba]QRW01357.1 Lipase (class 3) [Ceratobasidium sp. AG-Ba]